jgi:glycosyltransferase involved in cell wall biosynthesis
MKLSIVVPAFNEAKLLPSTLQSIRRAADAFNQAGWSWELIVCDNNSTDATPTIAEAEGARVVFEPINQIARARNRGASIARGEWLLFIDADSRPSPELFRELMSAINAGRWLGGGCTVTLDERDRVGDFITGLWNQLSRWKRWIAGSFVFCRRDAFEAIGGFSSELYASEELDLSKRLRAYARKQGKDLLILNKYPLCTSARKLHLYSRKEYGRLFLHLIFNPRSGVRNQASCYPWYDGRR